MLNKETFKECMEKFICFYPDWKFRYFDSKAVKMWYEMFQEFEDLEFIAMTETYCKLEKDLPTVAGILSYVQLEVKS